MQWTLDELRAAWEHVRRKRSAGGFDGMEIVEFEADLELRLTDLLEELNTARYLPDPALRVRIPKGSGQTRPLGLLNLRDKLAQAAVKPKLEEKLERIFHRASYAYRPGRGHRQALAQVELELGKGLHWVARADIAGFFDNLDHELLLGKVDAEIGDPWVRELIRMWIWIGYVECGDVKATPAGVQQGGIISPQLANLYLNDFDHRLSSSGISFLRYADDFLLFCDSKVAAEQALRQAEGWLEREFKLRLNPDKREVVHLKQGFCFLGLYYRGQSRFIDRKKVTKAVGTIFSWRGRSRSLEQMLDLARASFRSWHQHYHMIQPQAVFRIYDRVLGNEVSRLLQSLHRKNPHRPRKTDRTKLLAIPWLLHHTTSNARKTWASSILDFTREQLLDPEFLFVPFPKGGRDEVDHADASEGGPVVHSSGSVGPGEHVEQLRRLRDREVADHASSTGRGLSSRVSETTESGECPGPSGGKRVPLARQASAASAAADSTVRTEGEIRSRLRRRRSRVKRMFLGKRVLVVSRAGAMLRKQGQRLLVTSGDEKLGAWPIADLKHIWLLGDRVSLSGQALRACLEANLPLELCGPRGQVVGRLSGPEFPLMQHGARQEELRNGRAGLEIAREIVEGKLKNQIKLLKFYRRSRQKQSLFRAAFREQEDHLDQLLDQLARSGFSKGSAKQSREQLRNLEAQGARIYWGVIRHVLPDALPFPGRKRKGARDLVNSALNYGYGVLYNQVWRALLEAGLNPCISFLHEPFRGKPTLSYDLIEEFRAPMVDRVIFSLLSRDEPLRQVDDLLDPASRRLIVRNLLERWEQPARYRSREEALGDIPRLQAECLAEVMDGKRKRYKSWAFQW